MEMIQGPTTTGQDSNRRKADISPKSKKVKNQKQRNKKKIIKIDCSKL